jgi:hypothetical protein
MKYDPNDYQGNVVMTFSISGLAQYYYETDDEEGDALGALVHEKHYGL